MKIEEFVSNLTNNHYLGDGAYVGLEYGFQVVLYTTNGEHVTNRVYLEGVALNNFQEWLVRLQTKNVS